MSVWISWVGELRTEYQKHVMNFQPYPVILSTHRKTEGIDANRHNDVVRTIVSLANFKEFQR